MPTPKEIDSILKECASQLDYSAGLVRDLPLEPVRENIHKIGRALAEVCELRAEIFKLEPSLKPEGWDDPPSNSEYNRMFGQAMLQAEEFIDAGKIDEAIKTYESFIFIGPPDEYVEMAKNEIGKLRGGGV